MKICTLTVTLLACHFFAGTAEPASADVEQPDQRATWVSQSRLSEAASQVVAHGVLEPGRAATVKSEHARAASVLWIVEDGATVEKGDLLVELDASELESALHEASVALAQAEAELEQQRQEAALIKERFLYEIETLEDRLRLATMDRKKVEAELALQQSHAEAEIELCQNRLELAKAAADHAESQMESGRAESGRSLQARLTRFEAESALRRAKAELSFFVEFEVPRRLAEVDLEIEQVKRQLALAPREREGQLTTAEARVRAAENALQLKRWRVEKLQEELVKSKIQAPFSGVAARIRDVNEGVEVRPGQPLVDLRDATQLRSASVICIAPAGSFRPGTGAELLARINKILPFEVKPDHFVCKPRSGQLTGWIVVEGKERKDTVKERLASAKELRVLQVETLTPDVKRLVREHWRDALTVEAPSEP